MTQAEYLAETAKWGDQWAVGLPARFLNGPPPAVGALAQPPNPADTTEAVYKELDEAEQQSAISLTPQPS
jgi:hypothetical protein